MSFARFTTQLRAVVAKEVGQTIRDRRMMALLVFAPLMQLLVLGHAVNLDVDRVPTVVVDLDRTPASRGHLARLLADGTLRRVADARDEREAGRALERAEAAVAVVVPAGFERALGRREPATVQVIVDGSDPNRSGVAASAASRYFAHAARRAMAARLPPGARAGGVALAPRVSYNPRLRTAVFMVPGVAAMVLLMVTTVVTAMGLAREREVGTLEQVLVTPLTPSAMMLGKLLPFLAVGLLDFALAIAAGAWLFDVPLRGSLPLLFGATLLYVLCTLGTGLLISTVSATQQQAFMGGVMFMLPAVLLSGTLTPVASMPAWLRPLTYVNPVRYYMEVVRATLLKGAGAEDLWAQLLALAAFGAAMVTVASLRFRKQLA